MGRLIFSFDKNSSNEELRSDGEEEAMMSFLQPQVNNFRDRIVYLSSEINEHSINHVITQLITLANFDPIKPITLVISTYGGSVDECFSLYDVIKFLPCPIISTGIGKVMSAGLLLLAAGEKGQRSIGKNARIMMHPIRGMTQGDVFNIQADVKEQARMHDLMVSCLSKETKMAKEKIKEIMSSGHDNYYTAEDAIKMGMADKIIGQ